MIGIYIIKNSKNGKVYVGQTTDFAKRVAQHKANVKWRKVSEYNKLYPAMRTEGLNAFTFELIEECPVDKLNEREEYYIKMFDSIENGYNVLPNANSSISYWTGKHRDESTRQKLSKAQKGKKATIETCKKISDGLKGKSKIFLQGRSREIVCEQTGCLFLTIKSAAEDMGISYDAIIGHLRRRSPKTINGYTFKYGVETIPYGSRPENTTGRSASHPIQGEEIVHSYRMANDRVDDKGLIELARRSGKIKMIYAEVVREGDEFEVQYGLHPKLEHKPALDMTKKMTHVYAVAHFMDGGYNFVVLTRQEVERLRMRSPMQKEAPSGAWFTDYEAMAKAKAVKQLAKYLPLNLEQQVAVASDEQVINVENIQNGQYKIEDAVYTEVTDADNK